jgi:hypothetical protein
MKNPSELSTATILALAQERIRNSDHWCQGSAAQDETGRPADLKYGVRFCSIGALCTVVMDAALDLAIEYLDMAAMHIRSTGTVRLNDGTDHATVMRMFDEAIEIAASKEKVSA